MKTAKWEQSPGALAAFMASKPQAVYIADLYTFALAGALNNGAPLLYTTCDADIEVPYAAGTPLVNTGPPLAIAPLATGPTIWSSRQVFFDQRANKAYNQQNVGLDTDTWQVITAPSPQATIGSQPYIAAIRAGALVGAVVAVDRAYFDIRKGLPYALVQTPLGVVNIFTGRVAEVDFARSNAVISINSHLEILQLNMPRNLFQPGCRWQLFSPGCTLLKANFGVAGTIVSTPAPISNLLSVNLGAPRGSGTYALGQVEMTSGASKGFTHSILTWTPGSPATLLLRAPFPFAVAPGDTFTAYPGCDKQENTCIAFGNVANFGGMPFIPVPEVAA